MRCFRSVTRLLMLTLLTAGIPLAMRVYAEPAHQAPPLANAVILIIRHAEKPDSGAGLTPTGQQRALAYVHYFQTYRIASQPLRLDRLIATADTPKSQRPRLTLEPLSKALRLPIETQFQDKAVGPLADALQSQPGSKQISQSGGKHILICWHHKEIPALIQTLGADPATLLPAGTWPDQVYDWVIQLPYDQNGHLIVGKAKRIVERLSLPKGSTTRVGK